jgi:hypothetical protein
MPEQPNQSKAMDPYEAECIRLVDASIETLREQVKRLLAREASDDRD